MRVRPLGIVALAGGVYPCLQPGGGVTQRGQLGLRIGKRENVGVPLQCHGRSRMDTRYLSLWRAGPQPGLAIRLPRTPGNIQMAVQYGIIILNKHQDRNNIDPSFLYIFIYVGKSVRMPRQPRWNKQLRWITYGGWQPVIGTFGDGGSRAT